MTQNIMSISDDTFESEVIHSKQPVLVDFWAKWCQPCKSIAPMLEDLSLQYSGKVKIVKIDVDNNPSTPPKLGVRGIPTLMLFKDGQLTATHVGMLSKTDLIKFLETHVG